jgi:predicted GH43/DUF377 family glycosyl hydrolase
MRWKKLGLVYRPDGTYPWAQTHAMIPTPVRLTQDTVRVFVTFCDVNGVGRPGFVDVSAEDPTQVVAISPEPLLDIGRPGTFDENGVVACSVVPVSDDKFYMYYVGFELGTKIRYRLLTGLAVSEDDGRTFRRWSETPILERSLSELYFRCGPCCIHGGFGFRLWYVAGSEWTDVDGKQMPVYDLRYAESADGMHWPDHGDVQIPVTEPDEHGFGRPYVIAKPGGGWRMFYSVRRRSLGAYRLGYAESDDGRHWKRMDDHLNLDVSPEGFDSEAIMYAAPIELEGKLYLFYNGNQFGRDGFAVAVLEQE